MNIKNNLINFFENKKSSLCKSRTHTREINPKLGILGFLGLLGLFGLIPVFKDEILKQIPFIYFFFAFFGFFGFYYEGIMSNTLIDERFKRNSFRADAVANKISLLIIVLVTILSVSILNFNDPYDMLNLLVATIGISFGLSLFLSKYLLYKFENES